MSNSWPEPEAAVAIYRRLCRNDPVAQSDFATAFLDPLLNVLRAAHPHVDDHLRLTAAEDAILSVVHNPTVYDPDQSSLPTFLRMAATADLANALARERRHHRHRADENCVELPTNGGNDSEESAMADLPAFDDTDLVSVIATFSDAERKVFDLMRTGERNTAAFATELEIGHRPIEEQTREIKRMKDRIIKRFQRARETV